MGRGSPIFEREGKKIVEYFKNNVPQRQIANALQISSSTVHNIIKRFSEVRTIPRTWRQRGECDFYRGGPHRNAIFMRPTNHSGALTPGEPRRELI